MGLKTYIFAKDVGCNRRANSWPNQKSQTQANTHAQATGSGRNSQIRTHTSTTSWPESQSSQQKANYLFASLRRERQALPCDIYKEGRSCLVRAGFHPFSVSLSLGPHFPFSHPFSHPFSTQFCLSANLTVTGSYNIVTGPMQMEMEIVLAGNLNYCFGIMQSLRIRIESNGKLFPLLPRDYVGVYIYRPQSIAIETGLKSVICVGQTSNYDESKPTINLSPHLPFCFPQLENGL